MLDKRHILEFFIELDKHLTKKTKICIIGGSFFVFNHLKPSSFDVDIIVEHNYVEVRSGIKKINPNFNVDLLTDAILGDYYLPKNYMKSAKRLRRYRSKFKYLDLWMLSMYDVIVSKIVRWSKKDKEDIWTLIKHRNVFEHRLKKRIDKAKYASSVDFKTNNAEFEKLFSEHLKGRWYPFG